jgi:hypothetical protein
MPKLTAEDIVPGELYVFTDTNPIFSSWVGLIARAIRRHERYSWSYIFEIVKLTEDLLHDGYNVGTLLPMSAKRFERYPCIPNISDQLFS